MSGNFDGTSVNMTKRLQHHLLHEKEEKGDLFKRAVPATRIVATIAGLLIHYPHEHGNMVSITEKNAGEHSNQWKEVRLRGRGASMYAKEKHLEPNPSNVHAVC